MPHRTFLKVLQFSPLIFGVVGLLAGVFFNRSYMSGLACLGICFGAIVGIVAALACLALHRQKCLGMASLCANMFLFYIVAQELQIIC